MFRPKDPTIMTDKILDHEELHLANALNINNFCDELDNSLSSDDSCSSYDSSSDDSSLDEDFFPTQEKFVALNYKSVQQKIEIAKLAEQVFLKLRIAKVLDEDELSFDVKIKLNEIRDLLNAGEVFIVRDLPKYDLPEFIYNKLAFPRYITKEEMLDLGYDNFRVGVKLWRELGLLEED